MPERCCASLDPGILQEHCTPQGCSFPKRSKRPACCCRLAVKPIIWNTESSNSIPGCPERSQAWLVYSLGQLRPVAANIMCVNPQKVPQAWQKGLRVISCFTVNAANLSERSRGLHMQKPCMSVQGQSSWGLEEAMQSSLHAQRA